MGLGATTWQIAPIPDGASRELSTEPRLPSDTRQGALFKLLGSQAELQLAEDISQVTGQLRRLMPERYAGEISHSIGQILDTPSPGTFGLVSLFGLAAYFASNNALSQDRMDTFVRWVIDQKYVGHLERFLQIDTPTIHAFAPQILHSAFRIKSIALTKALLDRGIKLDRILDRDAGLVVAMGDMGFTKFVLSKVDRARLSGHTGAWLLQHLICTDQFELAKMLVEQGTSVDSEISRITHLYSAVQSGKAHRVRFLLQLGADPNIPHNFLVATTAIGMAATIRDPELVALLLEYGASPVGKVEGLDLLSWSSLNCREIYDLLREKAGSVVALGDLVNNASSSTHALRVYIDKHRGQVTQHHLEQALVESIKLGRDRAVAALLQHGVSPNRPTDSLPLCVAVDAPPNSRKAMCELLIQFHANLDIPGILSKVARKLGPLLLKTFLNAGVDITVQGPEALVAAVEAGDMVSAEYLLQRGVDVNTPGLEMTPIQAVARLQDSEMVEFLLSRNADINSPAHPNGGRTTLQAALESEDLDLGFIELLLRNEADISAPPALVGGVTALEAICHNYYFLNGDHRAADHHADICNRLLDGGVLVNRPEGKPSSALHGALLQEGEKWNKIVSRMLEPERNAIISHMWHDPDPGIAPQYLEPRTPLQLAANRGQADIVRMLLDRGADVNEAPAPARGRTALQAAASGFRGSPDMDLVKFLLEKGADINAAPAVFGGLTALQAAAISGDIMLAKFLLVNGAKVNAASAFREGRYAIEGAAEHGRLDMVQLLLNAGAKGNVRDGTGFAFAITLAKGEGHFAIADMLEDVEV